METMTEGELQAWLRSHSKGRQGERGREPVYESIRVPGVPSASDPYPEEKTERRVVGTKITAWDGATIVVRNTQESGQAGPDLYVVTARMDAAPSEASDRTPAQTRADEAVATAKEQELAERERENNERSYNASHPDEFGEMLPETHAERASRVAKRRIEERQMAATQEQIRASQAGTAAQAARTRVDERTLESREREGAADRALRAQEMTNAERQREYERNKPSVLNQASRENKFIAVYNPKSGQIEYQENQNYDSVKAAAEERRAELASQIQSRQITLQEAQQQYKQWFDTNVQIPLFQAQEARAKAEERRQALEAEERRRQFAADYKLRRGQLGEQAAQRATQAEISLLPYRAGPTEAAEMSSAINSLAAGGKINGPDASAGIHFTPGAFEFSAPDFASIAKRAAAQALEGISSYKPSQQQYQTADYSGIPGINPSGAPAPVSVGSVYQPPPPPET